MSISKLISLCKASVHITANSHRAYFQRVEEYLMETPEGIEDIKPELLSKMAETDTLIVLQFYPFTSIGSYVIYHYNIDRAIERALEIIAENS